MQDNLKPTVSSTADLQREVAQLMIESLNLEVTADQITPDDPLYGDGLGLDSIDVLEVALEVSKRYGLQLRSDSPDNQHIFSSLRSLCDYIATQSSAPTLKIWITPFASVAMLEKLALLKIASCKAPVLSSVSWRRTSTTQSGPPCFSPAPSPEPVFGISPPA